MEVTYQHQVVMPGDRASRYAKKVCAESYKNCKAVHIVPHDPGNFRGPVGFVWQHALLEEMAKYRVDNNGEIQSWRLLEAVENDGAGGKPQFFALVGTKEVLHDLGWEIIEMVAADFARSGRFAAVIDNEMNLQRITDDNFQYFQAVMDGYADHLAQSRLVNITGEIAVMRNSITAFCDAQSDSQLVLTWGASCIGLARKKFLITGGNIRPKMPIVGFWEPGYGCSGGGFLSDVVMRTWGPSAGVVQESQAAREFAAKLCVPTKPLARTVTRIVGWNDDGSEGVPMAKIAGIAHITGGGVWEKLRDILPMNVGAVLDSMPKPAEVLLEAQELSCRHEDLLLTDYDAYGTLHGGCRMLLVCKTTKDAEIVIGEAEKDSIKAQVVGRTVESGINKITIYSRFKEGKVVYSHR